MAREKKFKSDLCDHVTYYQEYLRNHMKKVHKIKQEIQDDNTEHKCTISYGRAVTWKSCSLGAGQQLFQVAALIRCATRAAALVACATRAAALVASKLPP